TPPIYVQVTEDGELTVGAKLETNGMLWCIWDNFVLTYLGPDADFKALQLGALITSVEELRSKATELKDNAGVAPATVEALEAALAGSEEIEETVEAYDTAIAALEAANKQAEIDIKNKTAIDAMYALMENTNVYTTEAYETYKAKADEYLAKYNDGKLTETVVNPLSVQGWHSDNNYDDLLLSAWSIGGEQCKDYDKALYINTWSVEGENDGTEFKVPFFEYFVGNAESLGTNTLTATMEGLAPGTYAVTAWVRNQPKSGVAAADVTGITLQLNDGEAVDVTEGEAKAGFNIGEFSAVGVVGEDGKLLITVNVAEDNNSHWLSFKNVKFVPVVNPSSCIANAEFDPAAEPLGWTENISEGFRDYGMGQIGTYEVRISPATVDETHLETEYCAGFECRWTGNFAAYSQTTGILPPGNYKLTFDVENVNEATAKANYNNLFTVTAGENVYADNSTEWMEGKSSWTSHSIPFTITTPAPITISLGYGTGSNNISADNTPALYVSHLQLSEYTLEEAQADANAELDALAPIGEGLFMYAQADIDAAKEAVAAATTIKEVKAVAMPTQKAPEAEKQYILKNKQADLYMTLSEEGISIAEEPCTLTFEAADGDKYYLTDGEYYVGLAGTDNWSMSTAADKKEALAISCTIVEGVAYYTLGESKGMVGVDYPVKDNTGCWANKGTGDGDAVLWTIEEYVAPVPTFAGIIEQTLSRPDMGVLGTETSEQTVKIAEAGEGLVDITFSGFKFPVLPFTVPEFTISNVAAETADDGSITYAAGNFQVEVPSGMMSAYYNGTLEGVQASAEAIPLFKLVLQNATTDEVYFGADQDAIDAYKASLEPKSTEIAVNIERIVNQEYAAQTESFDFTEAAEFLGVDAITEDMLRVVEADGTLNSDIAKYDGWFNKDGYAQTWGDNSFVCVKLFQAIEDGKYEICDMNTAQVGDEVTAKWAAVNGEKTVYININVKFIEKPVIALTFDELNKLGDDVV
ncbi:MAG: hypothetical protein K2H92_07860, partial [Bacteroidaceae bacterium]|nr:hypothetical protein [Bacteroidaceae bacterium]